MNNFNKNRGKRRDFNKRERPQMYETTCSACGKRCEVPFRPTGQKPVYCNDCFRNNERRGGGFEKPSYRQESFQGKREAGFGKEEFDKLIARLDTIINILTAKEVKKSIAKKTKKKVSKKK